jgi:superfamily I DNA and/or RNA helicase
MCRSWDHILVQSLRPTVMLVEEAGQVLEAHILGSLVPSVEHLIMIGDPLQLRPTINNYRESCMVLGSCPF